MEHTHCLVEFPLGVSKNAIGGIKTGNFHILVGKSLGRAHTGKAAFDLRIDMGRLFLDPPGGIAHPTAHNHHQCRKDGHHQAYHQRQFPLEEGHGNNRTDHGQTGGQQIFRAMVGQLCDVIQISGQPAHQLTGAVLVVKIEAHFLHVPKQIPANVRFHPDAKGVTVVGNDVIQKRPDQVADAHHRHHNKEDLIQRLGEHFVQSLTGHQGENQVNRGNEHRAENVHCKQALMFCKICQKNCKRTLVLIILCCHFHHL